jgi:transposase
MTTSRSRASGSRRAPNPGYTTTVDANVSYVQASQDLGVHTSQLRDWVKKFADDPQHAFPGQGQMKPEQLEIARLKREVTKLKAERDILKKAAAYFAKESM